MSEAKGKNKLSALLMASLLAANFVCAGEAYKNNVVDVRVNKESGNAVKVTIYTDRPYTDPVVVNKKANNKYVILMPETSSSLKGAPTVNNGAGTISNVSVNTQSAAGGKGYTKIIITSEKAITVVPRTQQMLGVKPVEHKNNVTKLDTTKPVTTPKTTDAQKLAQQKAKQAADAKAEAQKKAAAQKAAQQKAKEEQAKKLAQQKAKKAAQAKKLAEQKASQSAQPTQKPTPVAQQPVSKQPIEVLEQEVKTGQSSTLPDSSDAILNKEINDNLKAKEERLGEKGKKKSKPAIFDANLGDKSVLDNIKAVIKDYQNISIWKLLLLAGAVTFPIIVIMIILTMDKKINKKIDKSFRKEDEETIDYGVDDSVEPYTPPPTAPEQVYSSFDEMLDQVDEPVPSYHEEQLHQAEYEKFAQSVNEPFVADEPIIKPDEQPQFINDYSDNDFENDFIPEESEPVQENIPDEYMAASVQDEPVNIAEPEIIEPAEPPAPIEPVAPIQPTEEYNPDGFLSESDFTQVNDKDFFDELVIQTMANNNSDGLPEESPADEIFNFMREEEQPAEQPIEEAPLDTFAESAEDTFAMGFAEPEETAPQESDELTMLTEVKLNDTTGLYLVNYENFSSLVGHIGDDYFVVKKFDEIVNENIIVKPTEKLKNATRYLVRVGKNKMVVEVTPMTMNRLLDL